jgi:hypothetical protein
VTIQASEPHLQDELTTYQQHRDDLLEQAAGKFVLIHGTVIAGLFESQMQAVNAGYERFGNVPFLVKRIVSVETPLVFATPLVGI